MPRSTFYYRGAADADELPDTQLVDLISSIQDELPGYGYVASRTSCDAVATSSTTSVLHA
ncbi:MAG: hypothetical protein J0H69_08720 [Burkholderiales bacterium]|nr:hypothetical protein [Burkholderiales bacterium]